MTTALIILACTLVTVFGYYCFHMLRRWRFTQYVNALYAAQGDDFHVPMFWEFTPLPLKHNWVTMRLPWM